jgi:hypothetical protein
MNEERICCMCGEHKKFLARVNTGKKYYCIKCQTKITKSGMDYWKPCSQVEFFESMLSEMREGSNRKSGNMFSNIKRTLQYNEEEYPKDENTSKSLPSTLQGFIVRQPYSSQIINGTKKYEFRNFKTTKLNIPVYLLSEGMVLGKIMFTEIKENNKRWKYAWKIKVLKKLTQPWRYSHPQGAQRWVKHVIPKK